MMSFFPRAVQRWIMLGVAIAVPVSVRAARRLDTFADPGTEPRQVQENVPVIQRRSRIPGEVILRAISNDPFFPERGGAPAQLTSSAASRLPAPAHQTPLPMFRLIGTTLLDSDRGFAVVATDGIPPKTMALGDSLAGFVLRRLRRGEITLISKDTSLMLKLTPAGN